MVSKQAELRRVHEKASVSLLRWLSLCLRLNRCGFVVQTAIRHSADASLILNPKFSFDVGLEQQIKCQIFPLRCLLKSYVPSSRVVWRWVVHFHRFAMHLVLVSFAHNTPTHQDRICIRIRKPTFAIFENPLTFYGQFFTWIDW